MTTTVVSATTRPALAMAHTEVAAWIATKLERVRVDLGWWFDVRTLEPDAR